MGVRGTCKLIKPQLCGGKREGLGRGAMKYDAKCPSIYIYTIGERLRYMSHHARRDGRMLVDCLLLE